jgi:hypothetical protein
MKFQSLVLTSLWTTASAFQVTYPRPRCLVQKYTSHPSFVSGRGDDVNGRRRRRRPTHLLATDTSKAVTNPDCGCGGPELLSGDVPEQVRSRNPREAMRSASVFRVSDGQPVSMDELLGTDENQLSIAVFLRSLG